MVEAVGDRFVLAHLSDPHLAPLPRPRIAELASKRLLGYLNWRHSRHRVHRSEALDAITHDLRAAHPGHIAVTGDLVNIALPAEFVQARRWLETLGSPDDVSVVPGNHDAYVAAAARHGDRHWAPYMAGDVPPPPCGEGSGVGVAQLGPRLPQPPDPPPRPSPTRGEGEEAAAPDAIASRHDVGGRAPFPYLRLRGPVALIGLSTAIATPLFMATGALGDAQIARTATMLGALRGANLFRVVMIHHPPLAPPSSHHKRLIDAAAFREAIAGVGAELIIHGHDHVHSLGWIAGDGGRVPVVGVPSASAATGTKHLAAYNLYRIGGGPGAWRCEMVSRGLRPTGGIAELNRLALWGGAE
jgi:3',5'-cyclic AMP phosphodiesterase CpdA